MHTVMADVWKSQGRKFCEICKVWFGDNRASIEFHERGKKHKDALAAKLRELSKASREKEKMQAQMSHALASMEAAALKSMRENGEGLEHGPALPSTGLASKIFDPRQIKDVGTMAREMAKLKKERQDTKSQKRAAPSVPSFTPKYLKREFPLPVEFMESSNITIKQEPLPSTNETVYVEADAGDGRTYYYHMYTGESQWEKPTSFFTAEEYKKMLGTDPATCTSQCSSSKTENSSTNNTFATDARTPSSEADKSTNQVLIKSEPHKDNITDVPVDNIPLPDATVTNRAIKEEDFSEELESTETDSISMPSSANNVDTNSEINQPSLAEPEEENSSVSHGPFGSWQRVKEQDKQPVFSPLTAKYRAEEERERKRAEAKEKMDAKMLPKLEFTEKTGAVLTKKIKGPIEFKKRTATKNFRQRTQ
ncbi:WW domain protein [Dictyocaulus viviparus]|uniref:WW domain protein n=1 Tax=Dictyocaulus viviparus TaxID=29172 RepID=A0A0D8Y3Z2_DICVI|nr:WW domain protein [Dictyocaulus viviparus]